MVEQLDERGVGAEPAEAVDDRLLDDVPPHLVRHVQRRIALGKKRLCFGRYVIIRELGRGGMGRVYDGWDPRIGRAVAVKTVEPDLIKDEAERRELIDRFLGEIRLVGQLRHPGIVTIFDYGEDPVLGSARQRYAPGRVYFYVMEHLRGRTLAHMLRMRRQLSDLEGLRIATDVACALGAAHAQKIIHRDIKPGNIFIRDNGRAVLLDFGIAKAHTQALTRQGHILGTPSYLAPERFGSGAVDGRADLFSLGVLLYTMLAGTAPFAGRNVEELMDQIRHRPHPPLKRGTGPGRAVCAVVDRLLAKAPDQRYSSAAQAVEALEAVMSAVSEAPPEPLMVEQVCSAELVPAETVPDRLVVDLARTGPTPEPVNLSSLTEDLTARDRPSLRAPEPAKPDAPSSDDLLVRPVSVEALSPDQVPTESARGAGRSAQEPVAPDLALASRASQPTEGARPDSVFSDLQTPRADLRAAMRRGTRKRSAGLLGALLLAVGVGLFLGRVQRSKGEVADAAPARARAETVRHLQPALVPPRPAADMIRDAETAMAEGRLSMAAAHFQRALEAAPEGSALHVEALAGRARVLRAQGAELESRVLYGKVLTLSEAGPIRTEALAGVGAQRTKSRPPADLSAVCRRTATRFLADPGGGARAFDRLVRRHGNEPCLYKQLAVFRSRLDHGAAALSAYERYLKLAPAAPDRAAVQAKVAGLRRQLSP